ncbi:hypothetical protein A2334_00550 [Candidatus Roizmanbacteria bacterium RIFOXYB2_FULL_38_10]|uniref:Transcription regulator TrmB N-terminal domain-containing protein n=1 Tax=Candidatus Roizmanbacteria bacterium RIFOXYD1_FULL_38_12 TaxID=1802093 RepID=A0A1F7L190_9BACT|nr:MAG: hypothetical protein A3K47_03820 [Candidatus Roizmanbacteria bacterium RIFOXYA2_FULL_38_14]OGK63885.1 MAG: hypothetical protein A3K27_03820 [Candidatus Roizmanbacteria bacterium RIFOXYA1_FULL_37_12]OGK65731.1 MAG: hypothetical protein A3K38_03820 [Candidatus Roizmanbacteria bacterium RIFOXYB1_FULL_40_23]OGK68176.1 MAG: hypothetical protein A2334_00550 [Candidatus Roizmanbacteria bacterium RIFOXYB2_FULL_38_10]OGK70136.1 MAG: hypothetical protein A3K21_03825 [Candidatus Roizmanbacteria ba
MNNILLRLGLTSNESSIYLTLLKHKEKTAAEIARILSMDKSSCYRAVESLVKQGLLITIPRRRGTTHTAASPQILKELMNAKKSEIKAQENELDIFIKKLVKDTSENRSTFIKVEQGIQAIRDGMERNLEAAIQSDKMIKEQYRLSFPYFKYKEHATWVNEFAKRRIRAGVSIRQIVDFAGSSAFAPIMKTDKKLLKEIRLMPKEMKTLHGLRISGDITNIISFDKDNNYIDITIKDKYVTELINSIFDFIWERSEKYI